MKIDGIGLINRYRTQNISKEKIENKSEVVQEKFTFSSIPINYNHYLINKYNNFNCITFMGHPVHIVDGGNHATNMQHFANAISNDMDISMHMVETNINDQNTKQLKSLEAELKLINQKSDLKGTYIAVPALASVPILNIQDQYNRVMSDNKKFTPENLKTNKKQLLEFLKRIYENPNLYEKYIGYMDKPKQGIEYTYGVIQEINKLIKKGAKVYVPSGHPQDMTIKYFAKERGINPELYHYIATGIDVNSRIKNLHKEIKDNNWYGFNLLTLSDANIVGVKGTHGAQDYMFAAYDSCITDGARGVYNFSPIRKDGKLIGYSYTDTVSNQYPYEEFPANDEIENITKYVGKKASDLIASKQDIAELKYNIRNNYDKEYCNSKLYPVDEIFSEKEIVDNKIRLKGDFVDKTLKLFFRINDDGIVIFPKCDCEGSGKPSVLSMWGSCFAVFNAIARDIRILERAKSNHSKGLNAKEYEEKILDLVDMGKSEENNGQFKHAEKLYNAAIYAYKEYNSLGYNKQIYLPYLHLGELHLKTGKLDKASDCFNIALNMLAKILKNKPHDPVSSSREFSLSMIKEYAKRHDELNDYLGEKAWYDSLGFLAQMSTSCPSAPDYYYDGEHEKNSYLEFYKLYYNVVMLAANTYDKIGDICEQKGEYYPAKVCKAAAYDIRNCTKRGDLVLTKRIEGVHYIGDLYNEIKQN